MPPASLSTFAVTIAGPTTARRIPTRCQRAPIHALTTGPPPPHGGRHLPSREPPLTPLALPQPGDHIVHGDDALELAVGTDHWQRQEVEAVEKLGNVAH